MVDDPGDYSWSSYGCNTLGIDTELQTPHELYLRLAKSKSERLSNYRDLFKVHVGVELLKEIRASINKGLALGDERFTTEIEKLTSKCVTARVAGRPRKGEEDDG